MQSLNRWVTLTFVALLSISVWTPAIAQTCTGSGQFRICNLEGTHTFDIDTAQKELNLETRSRTQGQTVLPFTVSVAPLVGSTFTLYSTTGEPLNVSLTFSQDSGPTASLTPSVEAGFFDGSRQDAPARLGIAIPDGQSLSATSYSGTFEMTLVQYIFIFPLRTITAEFTLEVTVQPNIVIRNLGDMDLTNNGVSIGQAIQGTEDFCVGGKGFDRYVVNLRSTNGSTGGSGATPFELAGAAERLPYSVTFTDDLGSSGGSIPGAGGDVSGSFLRTSDESCLSDNARITVSVAANDWISAQEPTYTDTLTVTVTSQ